MLLKENIDVFFVDIKKKIIPFSCSYVGAYVCLLDSLEHVPDSEVFGCHRQPHIPGWEPHASTKSCEKVQ